MPWYVPVVCLSVIMLFCFVSLRGCEVVFAFGFLATV